MARDAPIKLSKAPLLNEDVCIFGYDWEETTIASWKCLDLVEPSVPGHLLYQGRTRSRYAVISPSLSRELILQSSSSSDLIL